MDELQRLVGSRLARMPRFSQRVRFTMFGLKRAEWMSVAHPDLTRDLFHHRLAASGRRSQLLHLCAQLQESLWTQAGQTLAVARWICSRSWC
jgi:hypothetical protein